MDVNAGLILTNVEPAWGPGYSSGVRTDIFFFPCGITAYNVAGNFWRC